MAIPITRYLMPAPNPRKGIGSPDTIIYLSKQVGFTFPPINDYRYHRYNRNGYNYDNIGQYPGIIILFCGRWYFHSGCLW